MANSSRIPIASLPGASALYLAYVHDFSRVQEFYAVDYRLTSALAEHAAAVAQSGHPRREVAEILTRQNQHWRAGAAVQRKLAALAKPGSVAVVTGQQTGIFGGPLFTLYKALTCVKLAQRLEQQLGREVAPIFWLAADDDDLAEVNRLTVMARDNSLTPLSCALEAQERKPVAGVRLAEGVADCLRTLSDTILDSEFKHEMLSALAEAYAPKASLPDAFAQWLAFLLGDFGLIMLNPADPDLRRLAVEIYRREIEEESPSTLAALRANARLEQTGFGAQVTLRSGRLNIFYVDDGRRTLEQHDTGFATTDGVYRFTTAELLQRLQQSPQNFSPNVILRPVLQDFLLPSVAYVAGPAEIAYFAQLRGVYEHFGVRMPAIYPRKSLTLVEKKIEHVLEKFDLHVPDFWGNPEELITRMAKREAPAELFEQVAAARDALAQRLAELKPLATQLDPTLAGFIEKEQGKIFHQLEVIEKKLLQAAKRQNETLQQQIVKAANALYPNRHLQERELSFVPFLCKYGKALIRQLYEAIDLDDFDHQVIEL